MLSRCRCAMRSGAAHASVAMARSGAMPLPRKGRPEARETTDGKDHNRAVARGPNTECTRPFPNVRSPTTVAPIGACA